jgi:hypothetical protein
MMPQLQAHVKTRDKASLRSHAQMHFIRLFREGQPLPAKVSETGVGYTLSGKPLNLDSTTATRYLKKITIDEMKVICPDMLTLFLSSSSASFCCSAAC